MLESHLARPPRHRLGTTLAALALLGACRKEAERPPPRPPPPAEATPAPPAPAEPAASPAPAAEPPAPPPAPEAKPRRPPPAATETESGEAAPAEEPPPAAKAPAPVSPPPPAPVGLSAVATSAASVGISWEPAPGQAPAGYEVRRGDTTVAKVSGTRADDVGLEPRTRYCYTVRAYDLSGALSGPSQRACASTLDDRKPAVPGPLAVTAMPGNRAKLVWQAPRGGGVAGYDVMRGAERIEMVRATTHTDAGLQPTREYCYTIHSYDAAGSRSPASNQACLTIPDTTPPSPPGSVVAKAPAETEVHLGWAPSADDVGVARYEVARAGGRQPLVVAETAAVDRGLAANGRYCYAVKACDAAGNCSAPSAEACATTPDLTPPSRPASVVARAASDRQVDLRWAESSDNVGVAGYEVLRGGKRAARVGGVTAHQESGLQPAVEYCYTVRAFDAAGNQSPASAPACATTPDLTPPTVPESPAALPVSSTQLFLAWDPSSDDVKVAGYEVLRGETVVVKADATRARVTGLEPRKEYCFRIRAFDAAGNRSGSTAPACATTSSPTELGAPSDLRVRRLSPTSLFLQWEPSESPGVLYRVYAQGKEVGITGRNTFTPSGKLGAEPNCFRIAAMDPQGRESPRSNEICARPQPPGNR